MKCVTIEFSYGLLGFRTPWLPPCVLCVCLRGVLRLFGAYSEVDEVRLVKINKKHLCQLVNFYSKEANWGEKRLDF